MKKCAFIILIPLFYITIITVEQSDAQDGFFTDTRSLLAQNVSLGIQPTLLTADDNEFMLGLRGSYAFDDDFVGHLKLGLLSDDIFIGAHFHYRLVTEQRFAASGLFGAQNWGDVGLKGGVNFSYDLNPFSIYGGLLYQPYFSDPAIHPVLIPLGVAIPLAGQANFLFEANIGINDDARPLEKLSLGLVFYLQ